MRLYGTGVIGKLLVYNVLCDRKSTHNPIREKQESSALVAEHPRS